MSSEDSKTGVGNKLVHVVACHVTSDSFGSAADDTLEATGVNIVDDGTDGEGSFMKCCSATAGEAYCFASVVVTFVLHDAPMKINAKFKQVDITVSKNQALQILYLVYSTVLHC